jgi:hypothetical protein
MVLSLNKNWRSISLIFCIIIIVILSSALFLSSQKRRQEQPGKVITEKEVLEQAEAGTTGELTEEQMKKRAILPPTPVISNTRGKITQVRIDSILVEGDGSNFVDKERRTLTVKFTESTTTYDTVKRISYTRLEGLKHLVSGMNVSIEGAGNIRGKTEFFANIVEY